MNCMPIKPLIALIVLIFVINTIDCQQTTIESLTLPDGRLIEVKEGNKWFEVPLIMEYELADGRIVEIFSNNEWREQTVDTVKIASQVWKKQNHTWRLR